MLATVADDDMPARICVSRSRPRTPASASATAPRSTMWSPVRHARRTVYRPTPEQREIRRERRRRDAEDRRKKLETTRKVNDQARRERKKERTSPLAPPSRGERAYGECCAARPPASDAHPAPRGGIRPASTRWSAAWSSPGCRSVRRSPTRPVSTASRDVAWWWPLLRATCWSGPDTRMEGPRAATGGRCRPSLEEGRFRPTDLGRRRGAPGTPPIRGPGGSPHPRGLELPLVGTGGRTRLVVPAFE